MRWCIGRLSNNFAAVVVLSAALTGCCQDGARPGVGKCADIPPGAIPRPAGTYSCQWQTAQSARARQDHFVVYEYEWYLGGKELGPLGQRHVAQIAGELDQTPLKVVVEPHFDAQKNAPDGPLNQARLAMVVKQLTIHGVNDAQDRVVLALPQAEGMYGEEAVRVGTQRLQGGQSTNGGTASPSGGQFGGIGSTPSTSNGTGIGIGGY